MKYMLLIYSDEKIWTEESRAQCMQKSLQLCHDLEAKGQYIASSPLHFVDSATSVRVREGKRMVTDGPFAETTEQLGGYYIIDVEDLDEAIEISTRIPAAALGTVEIRPIFELANLPETLREAASS
jgi:hypothetical protein